MKQKGLSSKAVVAVTNLLAIAGAAFSAMLLVNSVKYGIDWYRFIPSVLYILCFIDLCIYSWSGIIKSPFAFRSVLLTYGLIEILTGIVFTPVFPKGTAWIFIALSVMIVIGLIGFNFAGTRLKPARVFLIFACLAEIASAIAAVTGNPMEMEGDTVAVLSTFIRPVIVLILTICYLSRMAEKARQE